MPLHILFVIFCVLSVADGFTTYKALKRPRTYEWNRVVSWLFDRFGVVQTLVSSKITALGAIWYTMGPASVWVLGGWSAVYAWAIWRNYYRVGRSPG